MIREHDTAIALFAREPEWGRVKTRLEPELGKEGALAMHERLIRHMVSVLGNAGLAHLHLFVDGDPDHPLFRDSAAELPRFRQADGHLGQRMQAAASQLLKTHDRVLLIGADCVSVDASYLETALECLRGDTEVVLGPAEDGGYVLLGLRRADLLLFGAMPWGTEQVLERTRQSLRQQQLCWQELEPRWDLDRPEDLARLSSLANWPASSALRPGSRAVPG